jgi:hypothetical protein
MVGALISIEIYATVKSTIPDRNSAACASILNDFAIDCCHEQIDSIYGEDSPEMANFDRAIGMA